MNSIKPKTVVGVTPKRNILKRVVAGCGLLLLLPSAQAQFTWPVYEPFGEYTNNTPLGVTNATTGSAASPWWGSIGNGVSTSNPQVFDYAALSYPALVADTNSTPKGAISSSVTGSHDAAAPFTSHAGTIYASFLINNINNQGTTIDRMFFSLNTGTSASSGFGMSAYLTTDYRLKIRKNPSGNPSGAFSGPTPVLTTNATHLVVMRYKTNSIAGAPDSVDLWLDPTPFGDAASIPPPTLSTTNGANVSAFKLLVVPSRGTGLYTYYMDEIRLGDTWASVTPLATNAPGPLFTLTGGGTGCPGDTFPLTLSGSVAINDYLLYTNAVYAGVTLTGTGSALDFGAQTTVGYYSALASNTTTTAVGWMSNSPSIYIRQPVNLLGQSPSVITATNNRAQFSVSCTGDELSYHWFKDGNLLVDDSHITGSSTPTLVVSPAGTADIGGYSCVITNPCGSSATSTAATLTLDGVDDLVWAGNSFLNIWDVGNANYPYFLDTNSSPAVFNGGDNVKFDDSGNATVIVILTNILTPTRLTVDASRYYNFAGGGTIAGAGMLVKNGTGRLTISNSVVNTYSGGTIISNGAVHLRVSLSNLGTGPVTLAGGTLETEETQTLPNNIFVTANSALQINKSGASAMTISGALNGNSGTTLNITNFNLGINLVNRLSLSGVFTNNSAIVLSTYTNTMLELAPANNSGVQIYNGAISSIGQYTTGQFNKVGTGAVYLNAANTYNGPTTNAAGLLAGSGSITGPLVVGTNGTQGAGSANAIGTFTVNSNILLNGKVFIRVDKSLAQSNDMISATGTITNGGTGTITVTNIGGTALAAGDSFRIFSGAVSNGAALLVTDGNISVWTNKLAIDGTIQVVSIIPGYSTNISYTVSGNTLTISWPATHSGWILQSQTNSLAVGLTPNQWFDIPGTASGTSMGVNVNPANPTVFYRLRHP
jgi:autotransporter-associated beta strand protein